MSKRWDVRTANLVGLSQIIPWRWQCRRTGFKFCKSKAENRKINKQIMKTLNYLVLALVLMAGTAQASALPTCSNVACTTSCGYAGGTVTNGAYDLINHSPWLVCKTKTCPATLPCPVNCVEHLSECSATCGAGVQTPIVDTPDSNGGTECVLTEQACNLGDCPVIPVAVDCPTACGLEASQVADGLGGLKDCAATVACVAPVVPVEPVVTEPVVNKSPEHSTGGQYIWQTNTAMWIKIQIEFLQDKIERLQAELALLIK